MNDVKYEVEEQQAEDGSVNRNPELKQLSKGIDKATNTLSESVKRTALYYYYGLT